MRRKMLIFTGLALPLILTLYNLNLALDRTLWPAALSGQLNTLSAIFWRDNLLPRLAVSLLAGGGLALCGVLLQHILRNPLAEAGTLGITSGAQLGLTVFMLAGLPMSLAERQLAAIPGALLAAGVVFALAWRQRLSPVTLILGGLIISLYCGAASSVLVLYHHLFLQSLFVWMNGDLQQQSWQTAQFLLPEISITFGIILLIRRPLMLLGLEDDVAHSAGMSVTTTRLLALGLTLWLSAALVAAVGLMGFVGLFAPHLAQLFGARRLVAKLWVSVLCGAVLLTLTDQTVQRFIPDLPTGAATSLLGAPLLLILLSRLRQHRIAATREPVLPSSPGSIRGLIFFLLLTAALVWISSSLGRTPEGWQWALGADWQQLQHWRFPRILVALCAGAMLAVAGTLMQRMTGNVMASPEVLGVSSGAAFAVVLYLSGMPPDSFSSSGMFLAASAGAALTLAVNLLLQARQNFSPQKVLLTGVAISSLLGTLISLMLISGNPRMAGVLNWMNGSTYGADATAAMYTGVIALCLLALTPLLNRWLLILPLGSLTARGLGLNLNASRLAILLLASLLTAAATLVLGPLSFVGLMAPHLARSLGYRRGKSQITASALTGAILMLLADGCGRMMFFPEQVPAGLLATFIGGPWVIWLLCKKS